MSKLDSLIKKFGKEYSNGIATKGIDKTEIGKIPFSSPRANYMLYGGIPRGRIVEFYGAENSGKTTSALDICHNAQIIFEKEYKEKKKTDKTAEKQKVLYVDCENTLDIKWAKKLKVDVDDIILLRPQEETAEQILQMIYEFIETEEVGLVVLDSIPVMVSQQAYEKDMTEKTYAGISAPLTTFCSKVIPLLHRTNCTFIGINQVRDNLSGYGGAKVTVGGHAWKHACTVRIEFAKGSFLDKDNKEKSRAYETPNGNLVMMNLAKTKIDKPDRKVGFYTLNYENGIDVINDLIDTAIQYEIIHKSGAWLTIINENGEVEYKFQGKSNACKETKENKKLYKFLTDKVNKRAV